MMADKDKGQAALKELDNTSKAPSSSQNDSESRVFAYDALQGQEIRLIRIERSRPDGNLRCSLHHAALTKDLVFYALSYVWGDSKDKQRIMVNDTPVQVTQNLYDFLHQVWKDETLFRRKIPSAHDDVANPKPAELLTEPLLWWIDAICIDQNNIDEKSIQVPRMRELYSTASQVWMWLGRPEKMFIKRKGEFPYLKLALQGTYRRTEEGLAGRPMLTDLSNAFVRTLARIVASAIISRMQFDSSTTLDATTMDHNQERSIPELDVVVEVLIAGVLEDDIREAAGYPPEPDYSFFPPPSSDRGKLMLQEFLVEREAGRLSSTLLKDLLNELDCLLRNPWFSRTWTIQEFVLSKGYPIAVIGGYSFYPMGLFQIGREIVLERSNLPAFLHARVNCLVPKFGFLFNLINAFDLEKGIGHEIFKTEVRTTEHKLSWLLKTYCDNETTVPHDKVYGMLGLLNTKLPDRLAPNYRFRFEDLCENFTRYILSTTGDLRIIESHRTELGDVPSWVPDFRHIEPPQGFASDSTTGKVSFSEDGKRLTVKGVALGKLLGCSCHMPLGGSPVDHLEYIQDELLTISASISHRLPSAVFSDWLTTEMNTNLSLPPHVVSHITSMQDLISTYQEICAPLSSDDRKELQQLIPSELAFLYDTPCPSPALLHVILYLTAVIRYGLVSTGEIGYCRHKDLELTSKNRRNDEVWALKGCQTLAILRPAEGYFHYVGNFRIHRKDFRLDEEWNGQRGLSRHILNEDYFASKELHDVTLV